MLLLAKNIFLTQFCLMTEFLYYIIFNFTLWLVSVLFCRYEWFPRNYVNISCHPSDRHAYRYWVWKKRRNWVRFTYKHYLSYKWSGIGWHMSWYLLPFFVVGLCKFFFHFNFSKAVCIRWSIFYLAQLHPLVFPELEDWSLNTLLSTP